MKPYHILKDFKGTQTGLGDGEHFAAGTTSMLSDHLAEVALKAGYVKPAEPDALEGGPHPELNADPDAPDELVEGTADDRETKVTEPEETKPGKVKAKKDKAA
jgi:hypothetical protein